MSVIEYPLGELVELELFYKEGDIPISGLSPKISLRKTDNNYYFDFNDNTWKDEVSVTQKEENMTEVMAGIYQKQWDSSYVGQVPAVIVAEYKVEDIGYEGTAEDVLLFGVSEISPVTIANAVWSVDNVPYIGQHNFGGVVNDIRALASFVKDVEEGRWKIENNQMIFYKSDNVTEIMRFDLFDIDGRPTQSIVAERRRV